MNGTPTVSVVMPTLNSGRHVRESLTSILRQTHASLELIVVDGGSNDETANLLRSIAAADSRMRFTIVPGLGLADSLHLGCEQAGGAYIARMDADDVAFPDRIERQVAFLERNPDVAVVGGAMQVVDESGRPFATWSFPQRDSEIREELLRHNCMAHPTVVMRADALRAAGGYRNTFVHAEDYDLWLRIAERAKLANLPEAVLSYRIHAHQTSLRNLEDQAVSALAARLAAEARRTTGQEPAWVAAGANADSLRSHGVGEGAIHAAVVEACTTAAMTMTGLGDDDAALRLLAEAMPWAETHGVGRPLMASLHWAASGAFRGKGQVLDAIAAAAKGLVASPVTVARLVAQNRARRTMGP